MIARLVPIRSIRAEWKCDQETLCFTLIEVRDGHQFVAAGVLNSNCRFVTDEETLVDPICLTRITERVRNPAFYTGQVRWFIEPMPNRTYMVALDPSMGTGGDYSAIQVFMLPELIQVAEWQHNQTDPKGQVRNLLQLLHTLNSELLDHPDQYGEPEIYWTVENNSIGDTTLHIIEETGEDNFPGVMISEKKKRGRPKRYRRGLTTTKVNKLAACARFKSLIESDRMLVYSNEAIKQMKNFVARQGSYSAKPGMHDDLVSALLLVVRMLDLVIAQGQENVDDLRDGIDFEEIFTDPMPVVV